MSAAPEFRWDWVALACGDEDMTIRALVRGPLAVHRSIGNAAEWTISHVASGLRCAPNFAALEAALDLCSLLAAVDGWALCTRTNRVGGVAPPADLTRRCNAITRAFCASAAGAVRQ